MSRHSKNNTSTSVFTYRERQMIKDYGTQKTRIGLDSCKKFDCCTLCLLKAQNPHACSQGHIFCKSCIVENMVEQKKEIAAKMDKYQQIQLKEQKAQQKELEDKERNEIKQFEQIESNRIQSTAQTIVQKNKKITGFINWLPEEREGKETFKEPKQHLICPGDKKTEIKMKNIYPVDIKEIEGQAVCYACSTDLNYQKMMFSRKCGHLFCKVCFDNDIAKTLHCSVCMKKCDKEDSIALQATLSCYSSHNSVEAVKYTANSMI